MSVGHARFSLLQRALRTDCDDQDLDGVGGVAEQRGDRPHPRVLARAAQCTDTLPVTLSGGAIVSAGRSDTGAAPAPVFVALGAKTS